MLSIIVALQNHAAWVDDLVCYLSGDKREFKSLYSIYLHAYTYIIGSFSGSIEIRAFKLIDNTTSIIALLMAIFNIPIIFALNSICDISF